MRRHKFGFAAMMGIMLTMLLGVVVSASQTGRANRERARAERRLQATIQLMNEAFNNVLPVAAVQIVTRNPSHFQHVAPDIEILTP
jgi:hypothetical protein